MKEEKIDRIIEMAWEDNVRRLMRKHMSESSFKMWRKRVKSRKTKHARSLVGLRFKSKNQKANR